MRMLLDRLYKGPEKSAWFYLRDEYYVEEVAKNERPLYQSEVLCEEFSPLRLT